MDPSPHSEGERRDVLLVLWKRNIGEDAGLGAELDDAGERGRAICRKGVAQGAFFADARGEDPNLARGGDGGVAKGETFGWRFDRGDGAENGLIFESRFGFARKEGSDVAILAHAKKNQVKDGLPI